MTDSADKPGAFVVTVDGVELTPEYSAALSSIDVDMTINLPRRALISFVSNDYDDAENVGLDFEIFSLGAVLEIAMGATTVAPVFVGNISAVSPDFGSTNSQVVVTGYDAAFRLQFGTHSRIFEELPYSEIIETVISETGIAAEVDPTEAVYDYVAQNNVSTYAFVIDLADRLGYELISDGEAIQVRAPRLADPPVAELEYGLGLYEFRVRAKTLTQGSTMTRVAWDPEVKEPLTGEALSAPPDADMGGTEDGFTLSEEAGTSSNTRPTADSADLSGVEELAEGLRTNVLETFISGEAMCAGQSQITAGSNVAVSGIGGRFDGPYYVKTARHRFTPRMGYVVSMDVFRTGA